MSEFKSIRAASALLGVTPATLRRWERNGVKMPVLRTPGGHRRYDLSELGNGICMPHSRRKR